MIGRLRGRIQYYRHRRRLQTVDGVCLFTGYPRSGHSLVGALLDAHPEMMVAHELDVLGLVEGGYGYRSLYGLMLDNSRRISREGRRHSGYDYRVPDQWQGTAETLKVIGDKKGGDTAMRLESNPALLDSLADVFPAPVRFLHIVRNPFDNLATRVRWNRKVDGGCDERLMAGQVDLFFRQAAVNSRLIKDPRFDVLTLRHEDLVEDLAAGLGEICRFLGVQAASDWITACSTIVFRKPRQTRALYPYTAELVARISEQMQDYEFLRGYRFCEDESVSAGATTTNAR